MSGHFANRAKLYLINLPKGRGIGPRRPACAHREPLEDRGLVQHPPGHPGLDQNKTKHTLQREGSGVCSVCGRETQRCGDNSATSRNHPNKNTHPDPRLQTTLPPQGRVSMSPQDIYVPTGHLRCRVGHAGVESEIPMSRDIL